MSIEEQQHLFGAPPGDVMRATIELWRDTASLRWVVSFVVETRNRRDPARIRVYLQEDEAPDAIIAVFVRCENAAYWCTSNLLKAKMLSTAAMLKASGHEVVTFSMGEVLHR